MRRSTRYIRARRSVPTRTEVNHRDAISWSLAVEFWKFLYKIRAWLEMKVKGKGYLQVSLWEEDGFHLFGTG